MLENLPGVDSIMDDIIVWGESVGEHDKRLREVLERAKSHHLRLSLKKCQNSSAPSSIRWPSSDVRQGKSRS